MEIPLWNDQVFDDKWVRTPRGVETIIKAITFCGGLSLWKPQVRYTIEGQTVHIMIIFVVIDRDTALPVEILSNGPMNKVSLPCHRDTLVRCIYDSTISFLLHEAAESFRYAGSRPFDPHR